MSELIQASILRDKNGVGVLVKGEKGDTGVGIKSVVQTVVSTADSGENVITVTKTDNTASTFTVKNGSRGSDGATPNLTVGTVSTLPAGSKATATITGTAPNLVLDLGIPKGFDGEGAEAVIVSWDQVQDKPDAFPAEAHTHAPSDVEGLTDALANKAPATHSHAYADITGKPDAFPPATHGHAYSEITGTPVFAYDADTQTLTITTT